MTATPENGDWIVFAPSVVRALKQPLGGPWLCGRVVKANIASYSVDQVRDHTGPQAQTRWVMADRIAKVCISQGEARIAVRDLANIEAEYVAARDALKPQFQVRISAVLAD